jgi:hypothetical protein
MMDHTNIECNLMPFFVSQSTMPMQYCDAGHVLRRSEHSQWQAAWSVKISWRPVLQCVKQNNMLHEHEHQSVCTNFGVPHCEFLVHLQRERQ